MDFTIFKKIISDFSKHDVIRFLGEKLYNSLLEWDHDEEKYTKGSLIDILISVKGFSLFKSKEFRERFFSSVPHEDLKMIIPNYSTRSKLDLVKKASNFPFANNGFYKKLINEYLNCLDYVFNDKNDEDKIELVSRSTKTFYELLDYQYMIKQQTLFELNKPGNLGRKILIHMPTGTGKTKTTMHIITHYLNFINNNNLVVWIADRNELLFQALDTFKNVWGHIGIGDINVEKSWVKGEYTLNKGILFITVQSLMSMKKNNIDVFNEIKNKTGLLVFDECHKIGALKIKEVVNSLLKADNNLRCDFIGLTATPGRKTDVSRENLLFREFFDRIIEIDTELIKYVNYPKNVAMNKPNDPDIIHYFQERKILSKLKKEALSYSVDQGIISELEKELKSTRQEFSDELIVKIANNRERNSAILRKLKELDNDEVPTILFACSVDHAMMISAYLNIEKIPNSLVYGTMDEATRKKSIDDFKDRNSRVNIIINYDILTTGFDSTNIDCVFITRPTKSVILYSQMIGRGLRGPQMGGNEECLLIDVKENLKSYDENKAFSHFKSYWR